MMVDLHSFFSDTLHLKHLNDDVLASTPCHYCRCRVFRFGEPGFLDNPDRHASRDHIEPKCDGGTRWVLCCRQCNTIKGSDPYEMYTTFMNYGGRELRRHERKAKYRWFRTQIIAVGLAAFRNECDLICGQTRRTD